jgi:hypothetical protein
METPRWLRWRAEKKRALPSSITLCGNRTRRERPKRGRTRRRLRLSLPAWAGDAQADTLAGSYSGLVLATRANFAAPKT